MDSPTLLSAAASRFRSWKIVLLRWRIIGIAIVAALAIALNLVLRFHVHASPDVADAPLVAALAVGGTPLVIGLMTKLVRRQFGSDLLAGMSIVTSALLGEYLAGTIVILMLSGGEALEAYALRNASSVLTALAKRMPSVAHLKRGGQVVDIELNEVAVTNILVLYPHDICPVDGVVIDGHGVMDESYLTGEPFQITKTSGSLVMSGAINGESALTIRATRRAVDSRYARIMEVMRESEQRRPRLRRLGDQLGAVYTPLALSVAALAWATSGDSTRFLAVLVIATPCPLLIAIPVAIIGSISLCARRAIIVKSPVALEQVAECRTAIFDKTGTLTYGEPKLTDQFVAPGFTKESVLGLVASLERYSKHPLSRAILDAAKEQGLLLSEADEVSERPGKGLLGAVLGHQVRVTSRNKIGSDDAIDVDKLPPTAGGLECLVVIDGNYAATYRFRDAPRADSRSFIAHLSPMHRIERAIIVSGDRESEVRYLADQVGIGTIYSQQSPEDKLAIVRAETKRAKTLYLGDGVNDAPAMMAATVGMAIGHNTDVTAEAAGVVLMDNSLRKVDEFMHIGVRMRSIALQSAVGGMALSFGGMLLAASGLLSPVGGAVCQEVIDVLAVLNALRAAVPSRKMNDLE